ncbi:hypothetical protein [Prochlorococcus marinus]|uniref:hypothetical protein n=1 Tax=Prochlorococcus marinus TaxID=1219 RepID=UPI001F31ED3B|nr:hypothetical protein [Prochlorococcus marinus]
MVSNLFGQADEGRKYCHHLVVSGFAEPTANHRQSSRQRPNGHHWLHTVSDAHQSLD